MLEQERLPIVRNMPKRLPEELEGVELFPLCLATRLSDAKRIEQAFDDIYVDYTFEITPITGKSIFSILFGSMKKGVMFLVPSGQHELCAKSLEEAGLSHLIIE